MKRLITLLACLACVSCATGPRPFVQGDIMIVPPVRQETDARGHFALTHWNDGGTVKIKMTDATGRPFDVFFDHRITDTDSGKFKTEPGTIYLNAYPARSNSVLVVDQEGFKKRVLKGINY